MQKFYSIGAETEQIEFKKSTGELKEAVISIASILNKHGSGKLYFGVKNNGDVIGQEISENTLRDVSHLQMAKFATNVKATFTDIRREDRGSIIGLSRICAQYIIDAIDWKADIVGLERVETPEIPLEAVREAIINSYGHRLYNNNQCNEIDVFKDRIEIHTTGGFPQGHTPEEFFDGKKKAIRRNKRITGVLYYSKDMETFATGLKRIKDLCDEAGCRVDFRTDKDDFVVVFYRNLRETWNIGAKSDANLDANGANSGVKNTENVLAVKTIELIKKNP